ncbi:putative transmembrane protein [Gregarina niphandrodes]|uniref:Transmembrane protein n=1 Tax=Gregarina niphandrodes TaxID=110365 RepID=A0A023B5S1_GRENI|nr:putative transmembrane protein [Gregarina niphandrodes]EZG61414.1 putative transmembrane protein [Gregarina niphandrodes]|eukprot:XP_011130774.1 putative transmembrane protein [Gregarina niphandrodes]
MMTRSDESRVRRGGFSRGVSVLEQSAVAVDDSRAAHWFLAAHTLALSCMALAAPFVRRAMVPGHTGPDFVWGLYEERDPGKTGGPRDVVPAHYYLFYAAAAFAALTLLLSVVWTCARADADQELTPRPVSTRTSIDDDIAEEIFLDRDLNAIRRRRLPY